MTVKWSVGRVLHEAVEVAGEATLEACCIAGCFPFGDAAGDVVAGRRVVLAAVEHDRVQGAVELAVAAAAEPVAGGEAAGGWKRSAPTR
jgi:hypothetical protein